MQALLEFYQQHARPGRIGLFHLDFPPAQLINFGQRGLTQDGKNSPWVHCYFFTGEKNRIPWILESDFRVPFAGPYKVLDGPQEQPIVKWINPRVDRALILDPGLSDEQIARMIAHGQDLIRAGYRYSLIALAGTWSAILRHNLRHKSLLRFDNAMHCGQFVRLCLQAVGVDPWGDAVRPEHSAPELYPHVFPAAAEWHRNPAQIKAPSLSSQRRP